MAANIAKLPKLCGSRKLKFRSVVVMSALPPKADIVERDRDVRFVPKADIEYTLSGER